VGAAQNALNLQQNSSQNTASTESAVVTSAQNAYTTDSAHYASECSATATTSASTSAAAAQGVQSPAATAGASSSSTDSGSSKHQTTAAAQASSSPTVNVSQEQFCQNLQSTISRDYTALSSAQAQLTDLEAAGQLQAQRDQSNLTQSQAVLTAAQARQDAASQPLTPEVIAQAKATLATAKAQVATDQLALQNTKIIAPASGTVADTAGATGDVVGPNGVHGYQGPAAQSGTTSNQQQGFELFVPQSSGSNGSSSSQSTYMPLITLYTGALSVVAQIPETDMTSVKAGTPASLDITALGVTVPGAVETTALDPVHTSSSTTYYDVTISLKSSDAHIMAGMSVQVSLG